jgi:hypothetical protein
MSVQNPGFAANHASASLPNALHATLQAATRRIRFLLALRYVSRGLCWSSLACLIVVGMSKLHLVFDAPRPLLLGGVIGTAVVAGLIAAFARRLTPLAVAKSTDRRTDLKDRLSSALEFQLTGIDPSAPFYGEQLADTTRAVQGVNIKAAYPSRVPKELVGGILFSLTLFGLFFVPSLPLFWSKEKKDEVAAVKKQGIEIVKLAEDKQKTADQQKLSETKKAAAEAKKLGEAMEKSKMTKKESLVALQHLLKKMDETQKRNAAKEAEKMKKAGGDLKQSLDKMEKQLAQKQKENEKQKEAAAKLPQKPADPRNIQKPSENAKAEPQKQSPAMKNAQEAMKQMADALANQDKKQMQAAMEKMADQMKSGQMSKEEMQKMQEALKELAQNLKDTNQEAAGEKMQQMAEQMQQMSSMSAENMAKMAKMMREIGQQMGKGNSMAAMDMKELEGLAQSLQNGKMTMPGTTPGFGGNGPGNGYGGKGHNTSPLADPGATKPRLIATGKPLTNKSVGKSGEAQDLAKYLATKTTSGKHLPNGKIAGARGENGQELQMNMTGAPDPAHSNTPYYQVYQSSKKQAESNLEKENIPAAYKEQVKKYFENIRP